MKWVLGVDALARSGGAIAFCDWLVRAEAAVRIQPVHIVEATDGVIPAGNAEAFRVWSHAAAEKQLGARTWGSLSTLEAMPAEVGLTHALSDLDADGLVVGRRATRDGHQFVRLGRVARRLARELPVPLVVVPRDYAPDMESYDPILLCTDLSETSAEAARFARRLAKLLGRPLVAVHAVDSPAAVAAYLPGEVWVTAHRDMHENARKQLDEWCDANDLGDAAQRVVDGPPEPAILGLAAELEAAIIVAGSRRMGSLERVFVASTASGLAASAKVPVVIAA